MMLRHPGVKSGRVDPNAEQILQAVSKIRPNTLFGKELMEWTVWYLQNKRRVADENVKLRLDFQEKAIDGLFSLVALLAREVKPNLRTNDSALWLPNGMTAEGDVRHFG